MVRSDGNHIIFEASLNTDLRATLAVIYAAAIKSGYRDIVLDFSKATYVNSNFMLPVCCYCMYFQANEIDFSLILPTTPVLSRLFVATNWACLLDPRKFQISVGRRSNNLPAMQFSDGDSQFNVVNRAMDILMETISVQDRKQLKALEWLLSEITDNVINHSESMIGGLLQLQCFPSRNLVNLVVVDAGVGIPTTLRRSNPSLTSDVDALDKAIREGVTRNTMTNQGNGLYGAFMCCEVSGGYFNIRSGNANLNLEKGYLSVRNDNVPFKGALICATINYTAPNLLERALVFKGRIHEPANDYIDMHFRQLGDKTVFEFIKEVPSFASRESGRRAKNKIDNILVDPAAKLILDMNEISIISSSFADEVFGRLFLELGPMNFLARCGFRNVDPTVQRLIDRAIAQRLKTG